MNRDLDEILDDLFHGCAWAAFAELVAATGRIPDAETTRRLACRYYEEALAEKNAQPNPHCDSESAAE